MYTKTETNNGLKELLERENEKTKRLLMFSEQLSDLKARLASKEIDKNTAKVLLTVIKESRRVMGEE